MKKIKTEIRPYTKQFYRGNLGCFILALCETLLSVVGALLVSWLIQQLVDLISGYETAFSLAGFVVITAALIAGAVVANLIAYHARPKFITRGISQYKEFVFEELTKKNIAAFKHKLI